MRVPLESHGIPASALMKIGEGFRAERDQGDNKSRKRQKLRRMGAPTAREVG